MSAEHSTNVRTRDVDVEWARLIDDLSRYGLLGRIGACDAIGSVGSDVRARGDAASRAGHGQTRPGDGENGD